MIEQPKPALPAKPQPREIDYARWTYENTRSIKNSLQFIVFMIIFAIILQGCSLLSLL
jgi:hypothetical protein